MNKNKNNNIKTYLLCAVIIFVGMYLCIFPKNISQGAKNGIINCINIIIPSLFPFTVLTIFITCSGYYCKVFYFPAKILSKIFKVDSSYCSLFLLGLIGGYHSSAKSVSLLCKNGKISNKNASYLISSSTNAGPAFLISAVGTGMFLSREVGFILYISTVLSSLTLFAIYSGKFSGKISEISDNYSPSKSLVISVKDSCTTMCLLCAFIVIFSVVLSPIIEIKFTSDALKSLLCAFFEVTSGCLLLCNNISMSSIVAASMVSSFGGLCVLMQLVVICSDAKIKLKSFIFSRILHSLISSFYTFLLLLIFPIQTHETFMSNCGATSFSFQTAPLPAILLLLCCFTLPIYLTKQKKLWFFDY